ncbi:COG4223 family protein [Celeribacter sp. PS-C1]|uniref:COG4223 family protein n=1 Tax=Celeribacter sp. PS-C1 TaxID=2820813 RepID=UPI001CA5C9B9|nr:hypothetical protein [Celeribacter sp. PS-C1]MBW6416216.1 hypothetical protein [Celeribacter sp. PS-C1]
MSGDKKTPQDAASDKTETSQDQDAVTVDVAEEAPNTDLTSETKTEEPVAEEIETADETEETSQEPEPSEEAEAAEIYSVDETKEEKPEVTPPAPVTKVEKRGGFVPLVLGGIVCAALGYAGAQFLKPNGWPFPGTNTEELTQQITALEGQIKDLQTAATQRAEAQQAALADLETQIAAQDNSGQYDALADQLATFEDRMTQIEARPVAEAVVSPEATAAYERQLTQMQDLLNSEIARLEEAKDQAVAEETAARISTAKARLQTLVDAGEPFAQVLSEFNTDVPEVLRQAAADGIPSVTSLHEGYAEAARDALVASSHAAYEAGDQNWFQTALQTQIGLRSTKPKEGDDADAILSRAEQDVRDGLFAKAITTLEALPEEGKAEMQGWIADAQERVDVMTALDEFLGQ